MNTDTPIVTPPEGFFDISTPEDPGLYKKIIREGSDDDSPQTNDKVCVHYVGTLFGGDRDGEQFDSSRDRNSEFDFKINTGEVIRGWDVGVATMKVGELCELICGSNYAYGDKDQSSIPANSTLKFEVELLRIELEDLTDNNDGGVTRRVLEMSEEFETPSDASHVEVELSGYVSGQEGVAFDTRTVKFDIGDGFSHNIVLGIEVALKKMKVGEKSKICIRSDYGFGEEGKVDWKVSGKTDLVYVIKLLNFEKLKESYELHTTADRLSQSSIMKDKGTEYFKRGNVRMALVHYERIVSYLKHEETENEEDIKAKNQLLVAAHLNCALCHIKESELSNCIHECEQVLEIEPHNEKAIFRIAQAEFQRQNIDTALEHFKRTLEVNPANTTAKQMMNQCVHKQKAIREAEKKMCQNMFSKMFSGAKNEATNQGDAAEK